MSRVAINGGESARSACNGAALTCSAPTRVTRALVHVLCPLSQAVVPNEFMKR